MSTGQPCGDPILDWFARELTPRPWKHFEPLIANMIVVACYDFVNGISIETITKDASDLANTRDVLYWLRFKTGLSPIYSLLALARVAEVEHPTGSAEKFIQVVPSVIAFTNIVNDIISFFKEFLAEEKGNYIDMVAQRDAVDLLVALRSTAEEGLRVTKSIELALASEPQYAANFNVYARGITHFHTPSPRYRMRKLFESTT